MNDEHRYWADNPDEWSDPNIEQFWKLVDSMVEHKIIDGQAVLGLFDATPAPAFKTEPQVPYRWWRDPRYELTGTRWDDELAIRFLIYDTLERP